MLREGTGESWGGAWPIGTVVEIELVLTCEGLASLCGEKLSWAGGGGAEKGKLARARPSRRTRFSQDAPRRVWPFFWRDLA